jgi:predicted ArsR family transcriptional regulator
MPETKELEVHKALADDTRYRLYRYIGLAGRPVSIREMSRRLSLHPKTVYSARGVRNDERSDYRLLAEMLCGVVRTNKAMEEAKNLARQWGAYMVAQGGPKPGVRLPARRNLAVLQEAMARAGFDPRFRRMQGSGIEITLRDCPFRDLADDYRQLVCTLHRGLVEGMVDGLKPPVAVKEFQPFAERGICRVQTV